MDLKKKYYFAIIFILIVLIVSAYYVFFWDNEIEMHLEKSKYILNERIRNIELDRFPLRLQLDFDRLLKDTKSVSLEKEWSTELDFDLTQPPFFDLKNLYLVSFDKIAVYERNNLHNIWRKQLEHDIMSFLLIDGNNIFIVDIQGHIYTMNRNTGEQMWSHDFGEMHVYNQMFSTKNLLITNNEDKRLVTSILVSPLNDVIFVFDVLNGDILNSIKLDDLIYYISDYDPIDHAFYVGYGNKIAKLILKKN